MCVMFGENFITKHLQIVVCILILDDPDVMGCVWKYFCRNLSLEQSD